jgi:putative transcriptional regulator
MAKSDNTFGELLLQAAREAVAFERGELSDGQVTRRQKFTARSLAVTPPPSYPPARVQEIRDRLGMSQAVFAEVLGASRAAVRAWEQGKREPSEMARRLLEIAERHPDAFAEVLRRAS